ncbi:hypothetical protein [Azospirillum sp. TSA6c]|uniref:hypothetical protein n=1 Tax=Azospirillum sp. TSA6c TaxID=709813 RepID=UPI0011B47D93|nr:hypothetical protein [Azospirillum sp. TSA6c]
MFDAFLPEKPHGIVESADRAPTLVLGGTGFGDNRPSLIHESPQLIQILEDFCGCSLKPTYWYGPRLYQRGAILHEHIDRPLSHIISASIHVDSDLDEPWNISVESGGVRKEVNIEKGHMLLYEGVRLNHFRKTPLNGRWYAGTFMHYTVSDSSILPTDYLELAQQAQPCFRF